MIQSTAFPVGEGGPPLVVDEEEKMYFSFLLVD